MDNVEALAAKLAAVIVEAQVAATAVPEAEQVPRLFTVPEAADKLRCGDSTVWQLIRAGALSSVKVGKKRLVSANAIRDYLSRAVSA